MFQLWFKPRRYTVYRTLSDLAPGRGNLKFFNHNDKDFRIEDIPIYIMKLKIFRSEVFTGTIDIPISFCELFTTRYPVFLDHLFFEWLQNSLKLCLFINCIWYIKNVGTSESLWHRFYVYWCPSETKIMPHYPPLIYVAPSVQIAEKIKFNLISFFYLSDINLVRTIVILIFNDL